ncbi:hypothetical protein F5148DRAFT_217030 [Russula earlei]|uniref:Uncharacterized protein n=1 Tax=Russula earlei TaxID=71964 RepID=A0ACC0U6J4_9AGAM|nr:hypothetical protein F5148DRAFT_217030 [Russula earlei]
MVARHFLCCLPLRLGTLLISVAQLLLAGLVAAGSWYTLTGMRGHLPAPLKIIIITNGAYYTILALSALVGFLGTIARNASLLSTYAFYLGWSIGMQIIIDAVYLWAFFSQSRESLVNRCIDGSTDQDIQNICNESFNSGKWSLIVGMVIGLIIQIWASYIVSSYAKKLQDEKAWRSGPGVAAMNIGPKYSHVNRDEESQIPLAGVPYAYPYKDSSHSFGHAKLERAAAAAE